jgi:tellurite resistance protein TerC
VTDPFSWALLGGLIAVLLAVDLLIVNRRAHAPSTREALGWVAAWVTIAVAFGGYVWLTRGGTAAGEYAAGYLIEYSLSMDNVFVFALLFGALVVPPEQQHRLLFWGVLGAIVFRAVFILGGTALLESVHAVIYLFGALLVITGIRLAMAGDHPVDPASSRVLRLLRRVLPMTPDYRGGAFFVRDGPAGRGRGGRWLATPLLAALVLIESSDIMFAIDSVPAVLAITTDPFIVISSNAFAILGLRSLYFVLADLLPRFRYLKVGLGLLLVLAGGKMLASDLVSLPIWLTLGAIAAILGASIAISLWLTRGRNRASPPHPERAARGRAEIDG